MKTGTIGIRAESVRSGVVAKKIGMTRFAHDVSGHARAVTVLQLDNACVVGHRVEEIDGYKAVIVGYGKDKLKTKSQEGYFKKHSLASRRGMAEFRVNEKAELPPLGSSFSAGYFHEGQFVDVVGTSKGNGFSGSMKRHNFSGLRASHGVSVSHRAHGSTGHSQDPGRVFKNKKMAGQCGAKRVTTLSLEIVAVDLEDNLLLVSGAVPGPNGGKIIVFDAIRGSKLDLQKVKAPSLESDSKTSEAQETASEVADNKQETTEEKEQA